jgi:hypothetical protein
MRRITHGSRLAQANSLQDPILKILNTKRAGGVAQGVGSEFKPCYHKKKKKRINDSELSELGWPYKVHKVAWIGEREATPPVALR